MFFSFRNWKRAVIALLMCMFTIWPLYQAPKIFSCWQINVLCTLCTMTSLVDGRYLQIFLPVACNPSSIASEDMGIKLWVTEANASIFSHTRGLLIVLRLWPSQLWHLVVLHSVLVGYVAPILRDECMSVYTDRCMVDGHLRPVHT